MVNQVKSSAAHQATPPQAMSPPSYICGYIITKTLNDSTSTLVCRGRHAETGKTAVLKLLNSDYPAPADLARINHEYDICSRFNHNKIIKVWGLKEYGHNLVIVREDFDGTPLSTISAKSADNLLWFLDIALQITDALREIHRRKIIFKNLCPDNILYRSLTGRIKLIDFSLASRFAKSYPFRSQHNLPEGELAYISPEQTGRIDKLLDFRTDFYSLGVTLYKLLTGSLPFAATEPMELVHCHLAKSPPPPHELLPEIPEAISNIILKLLHKSADDRYQSCNGLIPDLMKCLIELTGSRVITDVSVGRKDVSSQFVIPDKLYGRTKEIELLQQRYAKTRQGSKQVVFISGRTGIGKTTLVLEARRTIEAGGGTFIQSRFDQSSLEIPGAPLIECIRAMLRKALQGSNKEISRWHRVLQSAIDGQAAMAVNIFPEIELIVGDSEKTAEPAPAHGRSSLKQLVRRCITACISLFEAPVIFFDDLHRADDDTLEFIEQYILEPSGSGLLIGTYRDDKIAAPLSRLMERLSEQKETVARLHLAPLTMGDITSLLSEACYCPRETMREPSRLCLEKTGGIPFFIKQLLRDLHDSDHLSFNISSGRWDIDSSFIEALNVMPNMGEILTRRLAAFSPAVKDILQHAACIGMEFDLTTLAALTEKNRSQTLSVLSRAIEDGLILRQKSATRADPPAEMIFHFAHDQVHGAIYQLNSPEDRQAMHLQIGRILLRTLPAEAQLRRLFEIADHFNCGSRLLQDPEERLVVAQLNLQAAQKAHAATASLPFYRFASTALSLIPDELWHSDYPLALAIHAEAADAAALNDRQTEADKLYTIILAHARRVLDKTRVYRGKIRSLIAASRCNEAIDTALAILAELGVNYPAQPHRAHTRAALLGTRLLLRGRKPQELLELPEMTDPHRLAVMDFLNEIAPAAYETRPLLLPLLSFTAVRLSLKYGNTPASAIMGYATHGYLLCGLSAGSIDTGFSLGSLALELHQRAGQASNPFTLFLVNSLIVPWKKHLSSILLPIREAGQLSLSRGQLELAADCACCYSYSLFLLGRPLASIEDELRQQRQNLERTDRKSPLYRQMILQQAVAGLLGQSDEPKAIDGCFYQPAAMLPVHLREQDNQTLFIFHLMSLIQAYLFGAYREAAEHSNKAERLLASVISSIFVPLFYCYRTLVILALQPTIVSISIGRRMSLVHAGIDQMRLWSAASPENFLHKFHLMTAELNRVLGRRETATEHYDLAIHHAHLSGYLQEEALCYERAATFYLDLGRDRVAAPYLAEAIYCYRRWGAVALLSQLSNKRHPPSSLPEKTGDSRQDHPEQPLYFPLHQHYPYLDMTSVIKASRAFTGEMVLEELLKKLVTILLENAGGQKGFLLLNIKGTWMVKARAAIEEMEGTILDAAPAFFRHEMSQTIVNYVIRSEKAVVLNNACQQGSFTADSYVLEHRPASVLCLPILHQGENIAILYLENNLTTGAFQPERLEILNLIASQAAISLKNSLLYEELEAANRSLHQEVSKHKETQLQLLHAGKLSALGRLSASIAHEFGNPLIGIKYLLDDLGRRPAMASEDRDLIKLGLEECERMKNLIADLHDLHRPSTRTRKRCNLNNTVKSVLIFQKKNLKNIGVQVHTRLAQNLPVVWAVEDQITQVVVNVTMNAADAMQRTGGNLFINTGVNGNKVELSIQDTGCGIAAEHQEHIFEPFFSTKQEADGTGLGLAVSYSIITSHQGEITFTSTPGVGSTFIISLPVAA